MAETLPESPAMPEKGYERLFSMMHRAEVAAYILETNCEYYYWDKLRHRPTPKGVSPEEAWKLVKLSRMGQREWLPLLDPNRRPFSYWLPNQGIAILHEVDRWGGSALAVEAGAAPALGAMRDRVLVSSLMEEAIATAQLEGAATTRKVAKEMLRTNRKPRNRSEQMIANSYRTIQLLRQRLDRPLTVDLLFEIQESMTKNTLHDSTAAGRFRTTEEDVRVVDTRDNTVVYTPPPANLLPDRMERLLDFANSPPKDGAWVHPLVKAAILHFWLAFEHPYVDGNGRTARALFYWFMLKSGYWLFEFLTISRIILAAPMQYYRSFLYSEKDENDLTYSLLFQLRATQRAIGELRDYLREKQEEQLAMATALRKFPGLNHRQKAILDHALRHPSQVYTFHSHQTSHNISYITARNDLLDLAKRGLLVDSMEGKRRAFLPAPNLTKRLGTAGHRMSKKSEPT